MYVCVRLVRLMENNRLWAPVRKFVLVSFSAACVGFIVRIIVA